MFKNGIRAGTSALIVTVMLGAAGLAGCATDEEGPFEQETYEPGEEPAEGGYYDGRFEEEGIYEGGPAGQSAEGPWGTDTEGTQPESPR